MPTLRQVVEEVRACEREMDEVKRENRYYDEESAKEWLSEAKSALDEMLTRNMDAILEAIGDMDLGPMPSGKGLFKTMGHLDYVIEDEPPVKVMKP